MSLPRLPCAIAGFSGSSELRARLRKIARTRLGEGAAFLKLQALMKQCAQVSERRNELTHNIFARDFEGELTVRTQDHQSLPAPTVAQLEALAHDIFDLAEALNVARKEGFLFEALAARRK